MYIFISPQLACKNSFCLIITPRKGARRWPLPKTSQTWPFNTSTEQIFWFPKQTLLLPWTALLVYFQEGQIFFLMVLPYQMLNAYARFLDGFPEPLHYAQLIWPLPRAAVRWNIESPPMNSTRMCLGTLFMGVPWFTEVSMLADSISGCFCRWGQFHLVEFPQMLFISCA